MLELGINYRPTSYWAKDDPIQALPSRIKGEARRRILLAKLEAGADGDLPEAFSTTARRGEGLGAPSGR